MKRFLVLLLILVVFGGCGSGPVAWKDNDEELEYLNTVPNPTVEQFRRRKKLQQEADSVESAKALEYFKNLKPREEDP